ncbi:MAG: diguanylate cyclase [Gammaproteobacteria bacterium]|nr:diguanylate cyclase [Gammaproteobacteria bacterium]MDH3467563.1 diguanylate cyclase [Gammaproteobacteria bacterium]
MAKKDRKARVPKVRRFHRLTTRIGLLVSAATLVPALLVTAIAAHTLWNFFHDVAEKEFPLKLHATSAKVELWYSQIVNDINVFATSRLLVDAIESYASSPQTAIKDIELFLDHVNTRLPNFRALFVLDDQGNVIAWNGLPPKLTSETLMAITQNRSITTILDTEKGPMQFVVKSLGGAANEFGATMGAVIELGALDPSLAADGVDSPGDIFLLDANQRFIYPRDKRISGEIFKRAIPYVGGGKSIHRYADSSGEPMLGSAVPVSAIGGALVIEKPGHVLFGAISSTLQDTLLAGIVVMLLSLIAAWRAARSIVRPVDSLCAAAETIGEGKLDIQLPAIERADEIGKLTGEFGSMVARLKQHAVETEDYRRELEEANDRLQTNNKELSVLNEKLELLSVTDSMTGLYNRRYFEQKIKEHQAQSKRSGIPFSVLIVDIDNFKRWNDTLGHEAGDRIINGVAAVLQEQIRTADVPARIGGDEFALLASVADQAGALAAAEKLSDEIRKQVRVDTEREVTVSIGVAQYAGDAEKLMQNADSALYAAKHSGRNCVRASEPGSSTPVLRLATQPAENP